MLKAPYKDREITHQVASPYNFKQTKNQRWGIYAGDRLLATVGSYEACQSIGKLLTSNLSHEDLTKAAITFKRSINRSLIIK